MFSVGCWVMASTAGAEPRLPTVALVGTATCPSREDVAAALRAILPGLVLASDPADANVTVELTELRGGHRVSAGDAQRTFSDPDARCAERARKAAVFAALVLDPPSVAGAPPNPPPVPPRPVAPTSRRGVPWVQLEVGAVFDAAPRRASNSLLSGGGQLALFIGARNVGAVVAVGGLSPTTLELAGARASLQRVPVDLAVRGQLVRGRWTLALDLGVVLTTQITEGVGLPASRRETRLEPGLRLGAKVQLRAWRQLAPFVAVRGEYVPVPSDLVVPGQGVVGTAPMFWVTTVAGLAVRLR